MLSLSSFGLILAFVWCVFGDQYTTKYDNINVDEIIASDRLLQAYVNCLMDRGPCTAEGTELKKVIPDALETECSKCSEKQKEAARKVIHYLIEKKRPWWDELEGKYDPDKKYIEQYKKVIEVEKLNI